VVKEKAQKSSSQCRGTHSDLATGPELPRVGKSQSEKLGNSKTPVISSDLKLAGIFQINLKPELSYKIYRPRTQFNSIIVSDEVLKTR
jgi:hypothetical protein